MGTTDDDEPAPVTEHERAPRRYGRGAFLGTVATGVSALWWGDAVLRGAGQVLSPISGLAPASLRAALPAPGSGWRIYSVNPPMPVFDPRTWRLRVEGLVERPLTLRYEDLLALPRAEQTSDFHCVTGWSVPGVRWGGVRFADVLAAARPRPSARALAFVAMERPYVDSLTLEQALRPDAMLALEMDGRPLSRPHGAPARVVLPSMYGYKNVKWVQRIVVTRRPVTGFWEQRGYDRDAWVGSSNGYG